MYIHRFTSPNENFEYSYPHFNELLKFHFKLKRYKPHNAARHPTKYEIISDVKLFPTVYCRIYCRKFMTLSNQMSQYKMKCIRICPNSLHSGKLSHDFSKLKFFKNISGIVILSVSNSLDPDLVQTVCKCYQQMTLASRINETGI